MQLANISEAKAQLFALIEKVQAGEEIIGKIKIAPDFDELPEDVAKAFGMVPE